SGRLGGRANAGAWRRDEYPPPVPPGSTHGAQSGPPVVRSGKETYPRRSRCRTSDDVAHGIDRRARADVALSLNALAKAGKPLLSWCCGSGICGSTFIDWDKDEVNHQPVTIRDTITSLQEWMWVCRCWFR